MTDMANSIYMPLSFHQVFCLYLFIIL